MQGLTWHDAEKAKAEIMSPQTFEEIRGLSNFLSWSIKSILMGNITAWYGNSTNQRGHRQGMCCKDKVRRIIKDPNHLNNGLFSLLQKGRCALGIALNYLHDIYQVTCLNKPDLSWLTQVIHWGTSSCCFYQGSDTICLDTEPIDHCRYYQPF